MSDGIPTARLRAIAARQAQLDGLLLFGSRARGDAGPRSDWDFAYLAAPSFDPGSLLLELVRALGTERIDLADLARAGGGLRFDAAEHGISIYERRPGLIDAFRVEAANFWCDAGPIIQAGQRWLLDELGEP